ncbi:MAG: glycosyltransferase family 39 protein [Candidatus Omnitrophica bacterium]|nr:glycosyltransferase family 39 protein [Candidatus Omnitrophota bacterium]
MDKTIFDKLGHVKLVLILLGFSYFLLMFGNNIVSLTHPDEVFYIQSAKEMVQYHKWFTPMIFDEIQFEKPFLAFALFAAAIKWFGLTPFVARFWPSLFGIIGVGITYWIAWAMFERKRLAFLAALIISSSFIYLALSRAVLTDMIFSVIVAISIGFICMAFKSEKHRNVSIILAFVFSALAVLTKGLLGFLFPGAAALIYMVYRKDFLLFRQKATLLGFLLFLLISLPWHIVMYNMHGQFFIDEYFGNVHVRRILGAEHKRLDNWYFYFGLMFAGVLPWSLFWFPTIKKVFDQIKKKTKESDWLVFLIGWIVSVLIFTQPAASKLASYIFPLFPAVAILLAFYLDSALDKEKSENKSIGLRICGYAMVAVLIGIIIGGNIAGRMYIDVIGSMRPILIASVIVAIVAFLIAIFNIRRQYLLMLFSYIGISATLLVMLFFAKPYIEPWVSCKDVSMALNKLDKTNSRILSSKFYVRGVRFYTDRKMAVIDIAGKGFWSPHPIPFLNTDQMVIDYLNEEEVNYAVVKEGNVEDLYRILKGKEYKIENLFGIGGKHILRITKL